MKISKQMTGERYSYFVNTLFFLFPIAVNSVKAVGDLILFILALAGIFLAISHKVSPFSIKELRLFSWVTFGYFFMVCVSILFSGKASELAHYAPRELAFLFAPFIGLAIYKAKINLNYLFLGLKISLVIIGVVTLIQYSDGHSRPSFNQNADIFAQLAVISLLLSLPSLFQKGRSIRLFSLFSIVMGLIAIFLSGTRGAWVTLAICSLVYLGLIFKQGLVKNNNKNKILIILLIPILISFAATTNSIRDRVSLSYSQYNNWVLGDSSLNSVSTRLEMYKAGLKAVPDTPLFGYGYRNANTVVANYANQEIQSSISAYNHLHNAYLSMFIYSGIFGLLSLLLLLFAPLKIFIQNIRNEALTYEVNMGIMLTLSMAFSGLTSVTFGDSNMNGLYLLFLAYLLPITIRGSKL